MNDVTAAMNEIDTLIGKTNATTSNTQSRSFVDEYGNTTFYVQNIDDKAVYIDELLKVVDRGEVVDLRERADIKDIEASKNLKKVMNTAKILKRLTKEEYHKERTRLDTMKSKASKARDAISDRKYEAVDLGDVRILVRNKVSKLRTYYDKNPDVAVNGETPYDFMLWAGTEKFNIAEIDYIIGLVEDSEVRTFMYERKATLFG